MTDVVTRFAPSPTGYLHVGGARTALFNRLYADRHRGRMLLRIEDTDRERSTPEAVDAILDGLRWLGIGWDGEPVMQHARMARHAEVADALLSSGKAYRCYATKAELDALRAEATAAKRSPRYDGRWRDRDPAEAPPGAPFVVRLRAPTSGTTAVDDAVQGPVSWSNADLDDLVLVRADGTPTYMLAVVVDDHDMGVTHIVRGDDHLTNAARQALIYDAMGWPVPAMAHVPLIFSMAGRKLSKRDGAVAVGDYRDDGILPHAMRNHLLRLGWGHGDREIFSRDEMAALFDLGNVGRAPSRFDPARLLSLNGHYIRESSDDEILAAMAGLWDRPRPDVPGDRPPLDDALASRLRVAIPGLRKRANTVHELVEGASFLFGAPDLSGITDAKTLAVLDAPGARDNVAGVASAISDLATWDEAAIEARVKAHVADRGIKLGAVAQPLRVALTGGLFSIGVFEIMAALGRDETLGRLHAAAPAPGMDP